MASLLQQGRASLNKEDQQQRAPPSGQGEGNQEGDKDHRESTSSTEGGQSTADEHATSERREKGSVEEGGEKGGEAGGGGEKAAARSAGAEGRHPSSAEMMHHQQLEYQRYRYIVLPYAKMFLCVVLTNFLMESLSPRCCYLEASVGNFI